ncbi:TlpA family protein disulfide reductase [Winogradskyella sp. DF17]|uniref:TlpA family protein disulfide reductase n=1 Tax=Winogradskyella pelagia TaxID=2819984 RepID=A0ABS3T4K0_9FLAO|nr:TlpA disulfide reductase family protein [Winogradskyella sp. DF17]MBO3117666.1 TlpA family protein disulfide reductase [Winogradskyella sp. DF17]
MKNYFILLVFAVMFFSCENEKKQPQPKTIGDFTFASNEIIAGEPFSISYNGEEGIESGFYHQVVHDKAYPVDVMFENNKATITVSDSISVASFYFNLNNSIENNKGKGYVFNVIDAEGKVQGDSEAAHQFYLINDGAFYDLTTGDATLALNAIETTLTKFPELEDKWMANHIYTSQQVSTEKAEAVKDMYINKVAAKPELDLKDYEILSTVYARMQDTKRYDSINAIISEKFPDSKMALQSIVSPYFDLQTLEEKEVFFNNYKNAILQSTNADYIVRDLAVENFNAKNTEAYQKYFDMIPRVSTKAGLLNSIAWAKAEKGKDLDDAAEMSRLSLDLVETEQNELSEQPEYYSPNQYKQSLERSYNMYADTYALLLFKKGKVTEAIAYQEKAVGEGYSPDNNERLVQYLVADEQYEKAVNQSKKYITEGRATTTLKDHFKKAFAKVNPEGDVEAVITEMEEAARVKQLAELKKSMLDERAPDFTAKNLDGEDVTLSSLKGKTVILDFWATWCGPCIASFPGMQKAVTKYKDDDSVVFLFVDTFESGDNRLTEVQDFIAESAYDFHVVIDPKEENGSGHEIAKKYNISGIPTKVVVGPDGSMNFKDVGFSGSNDKLLNKIDGMIQLLKATP